MELKSAINNTRMTISCLLIVLNGIEMHQRAKHEPSGSLLIVLNGIEIGLLFGLWRTAESFNRTKWN